MTFPLLAALLACSAPPAPERPAASTPAHPPVVLITLDTTRADHIGCYGYAAAETPTIDALAARGTRFAHAYTPAPLTIPAHASLFTGLLPPHHGVRDNGDQRLSLDALTLAERLEDAGWRTHAAVGAFVTQAHWGFGQGFDGYDDSLGVPSDRLSWRAERPASAVVDDALAALAGGADFLWVHLFEPHAPYEPPEPWRTRHAGRPYDGELAAADAQLARLLAALPPDALVVLAGDHGEALGEGGEQEHGLLLHDPTLHVPLILAGPGVPVGVVERPVSLVDVLPTLMNLLGLPKDPTLDGTDLLGSASPAVYSETLYGHHHYGWSPLYAVTGPTGRLVRGARDEPSGEVDASIRRLLDEAVAGSPRWAPEPATLDLAQIEQLQALGYLGNPVSGSPTADAIDPRDGILAVQRLQSLPQLPPVEQEAALRTLLADNPAFRDARFRLAMLLSRSGRLGDAMAELTTVYEQQPDSTTALAMGELWLQAGDPAEAWHWFEEAITHDPRSFAARAGAIEALALLGQTDEARARADLALAEVPDHTQLLATRALLALDEGEPLGRWPETIAALADERPYDPHLPQTAGRLLAAAGRPEEAMAQLRTELAWRPANVSARLELFTLFSEHGRNVDAIKTLRPLLALQPDEPRWQALAAQAYLAMGRDDLAAPHREACAGAPGCPAP